MLRDGPLPDHVVERLERQIRVDRAGAITQEQGEVMNLACIATFDDQAGARSQPPANHLVVQARARQQRRDRRQQVGHAPVGEDDQVRPLLDRRTSLFNERGERGLQPLGPLRRLEQAWEA